MEGNEEMEKDWVELGRVVKDSFNLLSGQLYLNRDKASPTQMKYRDKRIKEKVCVLSNNLRQRKS